MSRTTCSRAAALFIKQNRFYLLFHCFFCRKNLTENKNMMKHMKKFHHVLHAGSSEDRLVYQTELVPQNPLFLHSFHSVQSGKSGWSGRPVKGNKTNMCCVVGITSPEPVVEQISFCVRHITTSFCEQFDPNLDGGVNN